MIYCTLCGRPQHGSLACGISAPRPDPRDAELAELRERLAAAERLSRCCLLDEGHIGAHLAQTKSGNRHTWEPAHDVYQARIAEQKSRADLAERSLAEAHARIKTLEAIEWAAKEYRRRERTGGGCDIETTERLACAVDDARRTLDAALGGGS